MQHTIEKTQIENIWGLHNESLDFIDLFKGNIHLAFKGEEKFSRWGQVLPFDFLRVLNIEGKLKKIHLLNEKVILLVN